MSGEAKHVELAFGETVQSWRRCERVHPKLDVYRQEPRKPATGECLTPIDERAESSRARPSLGES
jgi:hypothetical protein